MEITNKQELIDLFEPSEGTIDLVYGRIGNGKTYCATEMILDDLRNGHVVYCNWHINYDGTDERKMFIPVLRGLIMPFFKRYYEFPRENLIYFNPDDVTVEFLNSLTDCDVFIDEGQWLLDSYEGNKFSKEKKRLLLHTRHLNRSLNIISQRTQAVQVTARGQVNRFFKCEKKMQFPLLIFKRTEYQDMKDNDVDETSDPVSEKVYFAKKKVMSAYDTKYLRAGIPKSQEVYFDAYAYTLPGRIKLFFSFFSRLWRPLKRTP